MSKKRGIDKQREAAISMRINDDEDSSPVKSFLSTVNALYAIKENGVFKIQLADDIDPERTNPNIPNVNQRVLNAGENNEIVARILLTAKCLFDEKNATVSPFVGAFFEEAIELTRHILELHEMIASLKEKIIQKGECFENREHDPHAFSLPSVPELDRDIHNIFVKADKAKDSILSLYRLHFFPSETQKPTLGEYETVIQEKLSCEPEIKSGWYETKRALSLIRNIRNASEHRRKGNQLKLKDFEMQPDGSVNYPILEIEHKDTPVEPVSVIEFLDFIESVVLEQAEGSVVTIRCSSLLDSNPFNEGVGFVPLEDRRHPHIRYYRIINLGGRTRILG